MKLEVFKQAAAGENITTTIKVDGAEYHLPNLGRPLAETISETTGGIAAAAATFYRFNGVNVRVDFGEEIDMAATCQNIATEIAARAAKIKAAFLDKYPAVYDYGVVEI